MRRTKSNSGRYQNQAQCKEKQLDACVDILLLWEAAQEDNEHPTRINFPA
jgi:hypothetical protein